MFKYIIFDFDGTIADAFEISIKILNDHCKEFGFKPFTSTEIEKFRSMRSQDVIKELKIPFYKLPKILTLFRSEFTKHIPDLKPFPDMLAALQQLKARGYKIGILTSNSVENVNKFLAQNNFTQMDFVFSNSNLWGKDKSLKKLMTKFNIPPAEILYVGDETRDIEASQRAYVKIASVTWGSQSEAVLRSLNPDFIAHTPADLLHFVTNIS